MIRKKIVNIAEDLGYSLSQFIILSIFNTILDLPHETDEKKHEKLKIFNRLIEIIKGHEKLRDLIEVLDLTQISLLTMFKIKRSIDEQQDLTLSEKDFLQKKLFLQINKNKNNK